MKNKTELSIASPCIGNCCLDEQDMCVGCFRLIDEILIWGQADDHRKKQILQLCEQRKTLKF
ncbi:MAG: DUF1289 domain-containing protein [Paraglaciecola sp.]|uniref:DUF1289 domain-containing protein n=1 Tax=Paraglaciecola sp. TaxID=1920173 RepID=UPI00329A0E7C